MPTVVKREDTPAVQLTMTVKNYRLLSARSELGLTQVQVAKFLNKSPAYYADIENLLSVPDENTRDDLSCILQKPEDWLFPDFLMDATEHRVFGNRQSRKRLLNSPQVLSLSSREVQLALPDGPPDPDSYDWMEEVDKVMLTSLVDTVISKLSPRVQDVIRMRFGLHPYEHSYTLEEVGKKYNVTASCIRQMEMRGLRFLRHPARSRLLKDYIIVE